MRGGQALIVILLVLGVALTVGLAIVARSVTEINVSTVQDESARALSAAVAGIEQSLGGVITGPSGSGVVGTAGDVFTVQKSSAGGASVYVASEELVAGDAATVNLEGSSFNGSGTNQLKVCWGGNGAVEVMGYYRSGGVVYVNTLAYDSSSRGNGFVLAVASIADCPAGGSGFNYAASFNTTSLIASGVTPLFLRVRLLYNGSMPRPVGFVATGWTFPAQGEDIVAVGQAGGTTQKVSVFKGTPDWLPMWDDAVFSGTSLVQ